MPQFEALLFDLRTRHGSQDAALAEAIQFREHGVNFATDTQILRPASASSNRQNAVSAGPAAWLRSCVAPAPADHSSATHQRCLARSPPRLP